MSYLPFSPKPLRLLSIECGTSSLVSGLKRGAIASLSAFGVMVVGATPAFTQSVIADVESLTQETQVIPQGGGNFLIDGGTPGGETNLFHSFERFSVREGAEVMFLQGNDFENIISRVTGNRESFINGILSVDGDANLFLMNPNGITFGENAQLNLNGSFLATTADEISFGNQGSFSLTSAPSSTSELSIDPSALVFNQLSSRPDIAEREIIVRSGDRTVIDEAIDDGVFLNFFDDNTQPNLNDIGGLTVNDASSIVLAGGPINIDGGILQAPQGRIDIVALAETGEVPIFEDNNRLQLNPPPDGTFLEGKALADVSISGSIIDVSGDTTRQDRGDIAIYGQDIDVNQLSSICGGVGPSFACAFGQEGDEDLLEQFDNLPGRGRDNSIAGNIFLSATDSVMITEGSQISNVIYPGSTAQKRRNSRRAFDIFLAEFTEQGSINIDRLFGSIFIAANEISLEGDENPSSEVGAQIDTSTFGIGNAGLVFLAASNSVDITGIPVTNNDEERTIQVRSSVQLDAEGDAGGIVVSTGQLRLSNFAVMSASTEGEGNPGNIDIFATDNPETATLNDGSVILDDNSIIASNVGAGAEGGVVASVNSEDAEAITSDSSQTRESNEGSITVTSDSVIIAEGSQLQTVVSGPDEDSDGETIAAGRGDAGNIFLFLTGNLLIEGTQSLLEDGQPNDFPSILASSVQEGATGNGGAVFVLANNVLLRNGGTIDASTAGKAGLDEENNVVDSSRGGIIFLVTQNDLILEQNGVIGAVATSNGNQAGNILLSTGGDLLMNQGSVILASAEGNRNEAGNIIVSTEGELLINQESGITASVVGRSSQAGNILVSTDGNLLLNQDSAFVALADGRESVAGNILVQAGGLQLVRNNSRIDTRTSSGEGGDITTSSRFLLLENGGDIQTEAGVRKEGGGGNGGNIILGIGGAIFASPFNDNNVNAQAFDGNGGNITASGFLNLQGIALRNDDFLTSNDITASSEFGADGLVTINEFDADPVRGIFELPELVVDVDSLLVQSCPGPGQRDANELGSLSIVGREGIPPSTSDRPDTNDLFAPWVTASAPLDNDLAIEHEHESSPPIAIRSSPPVLEGQDLITDANGDLWLVANASNPRYLAPPASATCPYSGYLGG